VDCSHLDVECTTVGVCDEPSESCLTVPVADGTSCVGGGSCGQCWSGTCQVQSVPPVQLEFDGGGGGVQDTDGDDTGFSHMIPSTGGGYVPASLDVDTTAGTLTVTTNVGDFGRRSDGTQNEQDNPLALAFDATTATEFRITARLVPDPVLGWDLEDDYQSGGLLFGLDEGNYVKLTTFHNSSAFGGGADDDRSRHGFQVGIETGDTGSVTEHNHKYDPESDGTANSFETDSVQALDLHLEVDPGAQTVTACYQADGGEAVVLETGTAVGAALFAECSYASIIHTSNDWLTAAGDPWHPNYDRFSLTSADADGDTYTVCDGDRNDGNADVYPGAPEICDGLDNDQDGTVDNGGDALCDDGDPCTVDVCAGASGCQHSGDCLDIQGTIYYYRSSGGQEPGSERVSGATLDLVGTTATDSTTSDPATGAYTFLDLPSESMEVTPTKLGDWNGISSLDAARVSQARVGLVTLTVNQEIAADVSGNGSISSYDASLISQFRVGLISRFPAAETSGFDWKFVPASRSYDPLDSDRTGEDYVGVLYGDVTGNWTPPAPPPPPEAAGPSSPAPAVPSGAHVRPAPSGDGPACTLSLGRLGRSRPGDKVQRLALQGAGCKGVLGLDLTLAYDPRVLSVRGATTTPRTSGFTVVIHDRGGRYEVSLYGPHPLERNGDLLVLELERIGAISPKSPMALEFAEANEGAIPVRLAPTPARRRLQPENER
jgi:hypothetical protein